MTRRLLPLAALFSLAPVFAPGAAHGSVQREAFAAASRPAGATLFSPMAPETTGLVVQNRYDDGSMWGKRYREFMGGAMGSGLAAGDYDGDGRTDLFVSTKTRPGRLFRNLGKWRFEDVTAKAGLEAGGSLMGWLKGAMGSDSTAIWHQGAVFADVDNDGRLDLYLCRNAAPNLLFINQGDGTFREEGERRGLAVTDGSVVGAFADYDRDGWLDVLILTNQVDGTEPHGRPDRLFRNTGKGFFEEVTARSGISGATFGHAATWLDYDGDGWPDLYVCNDFAGPDHLYRNKGDGTFVQVLDQVVPHTPYSSMGADAGDINNDGLVDLLVADMATTTREKDRRGLAASRNDVVLMANQAQAAPQYMRNALFLNTGVGYLQEAACWAGLEATDWTWSVRFEDFDNDGWMDLHVTNGMVREANNSDVLSRMMRALSDEERIKAMKNSPVLAEANLAYRNAGGTGFKPATRDWGLGEVGVSFGAVTADFDNDGDLDLAYLNYDAGLSVYRNDAPRTSSVQFRLRGVSSNHFGVGARILLESSTGVQSRELIVSRGYASGSDLVAHFGLAGEREFRRAIIHWPSGARQVLEALPANHAYTVTEAATPGNPEPPARPIFTARGPEFGLVWPDDTPRAVPDKEQAFLPFRTDRRGPPLVIADLAGDERDDVWLGRTPGSPARLLRREGDRYVETPLDGLPARQTEDGPTLAFDADGDGRNDLLLTAAGAQATVFPAAFRPVLYLNRGDGRFEASPALPELALHVGAACAADLDGDGDLDVFLGGRAVPGRYPETPASVVLRNDGNRWVARGAEDTGLGALGLVKSAVFSDVDQDGRPDLLVAAEWAPVRYFHNDGDGRFSEWTDRAGFASGGRGWWNSLAVADVNGDGRQDYLAGNLGLNTTYRATPEMPQNLLYGDFAGNGTRLLLETVWDAGERYPLRARHDLSARLPLIARKYPKNDDYARASVRQLFGASSLDSAVVLAADNFASGVFLSQADGTFRFVSFPREAQLGPLHGLAAADFDGDGAVDLCATQNSSGAVPYFHGGVGIFLKGNNRGGFSAVPAAGSGVLLPGFGTALGLFDVTGEGGPDLLHTQQGGLSGLLVNQVDTARWIAVRLKGSASITEVGARVTLQFSDGSERHYEITRGGGWLTQNPATLHVATHPDRGLSSAQVVWPNGKTTLHRHVPPDGTWTLTP